MVKSLPLVALLWFAAGNGFDLDRLMATLSAVTERNDTFTETRTDPLLDRSLTLTGRLLWQAPDRVEKITETPSPERFLLEGATATVTRPGEKPRALRVDADPRLSPLVESQRAVLAGDRKTLERYFTLTLEGEADRWRLTLIPRYRSIKEVIGSVVYSGHGGVIDTVISANASGGVSTMKVAAP